MTNQKYTAALHDINNSLTIIQRITCHIRPYATTMATYFKENSIEKFSDRELELISQSYTAIEEETTKLRKLFNELCSNGEAQSSR